MQNAPARGSEVVEDDCEASAPPAAPAGPVDDRAPQESDATTDITPSGIEVLYQSKPKRLYRLRGPFTTRDGEGYTEQHAAKEMEWREVPSVTTVLDVLAKGGLTIWGMRVGIKGVLGLFEEGHLSSAFDWDTDTERLALSAGEYADAVSVEALMKEHLLTTDKVKDSAADRGNVVHAALESWANSGKLPNPEGFGEVEKGYVQGIVEFIKDADPTPVRTEVMVGSVEHGYAGRYDIELQFKETRKVRLTPKQKWQEIEPGIYLADCKSSKGVYPSTHFRQLAAYEAARIECGYPPTDAQYVLNVNGEGSYAFVRSTAVLNDFLAVLSVYKSDQSMKAAA